MLLSLAGRRPAPPPPPPGGDRDPGIADAATQSRASTAGGRSAGCRRRPAFSLSHEERAAGEAGSYDQPDDSRGDHRPAHVRPGRLLSTSPCGLQGEPLDVLAACIVQLGKIEHHREIRERQFAATTRPWEGWTASSRWCGTRVHDALHSRRPLDSQATGERARIARAAAEENIVRASTSSVHKLTASDGSFPTTSAPVAERAVSALAASLARALGETSRTCRGVRRVQAAHA